MVKPVLVSDDAHMAESVKEHQSAESKTFFTRHWLRHRPKASCALTSETHSGLAENRPDEPGAIVAIRAGRAVQVRNSQFRGNRLLH